tara:strand:- start:2666 stop:6796 length:4131 start_codon:yes stop_codon:yes gene_type:complete
MLDWSNFKQLAGADTENFEKLCRSIVRRRYGAYGSLTERKHQPGVEYFITLNQDFFELGKDGQKVGWQCKWFDLTTAKSLTASSKKQILKSLDSTVKHVSGLDRWILWTPFTLSKKDQTWFGLLKQKYPFQLDLWTHADVDTFLAGSAAELRSTYFGELILSPQFLAKQHRISTAPISKRWIPEVHQEISIEKDLRRYLGEPVAVEEVVSACEQLAKISSEIEIGCAGKDYVEWAVDINELISHCNTCVGFKPFFNGALTVDDMGGVQTMLSETQAVDSSSFNFLRQVRRRNLPMSMAITNCMAYLQDIRLQLEEILGYLSMPLVAVLADAGGGKTQLAAEITAEKEGRHAGIFLHGRDLKKNGGLDDLAKKIVLDGHPMPSFQALISSVDAAAYRSGCRLPVVIDGLNEAQDPRDWRLALASVQELLLDYPNVLLILTLRDGDKESNTRYSNQQTRENFAEMALPESCKVLECDGFKGLTVDAVRAYFSHYKIRADLAQFPLDFFNHPLNLRIYCEVINRSASDWVTVTEFPASISSLFEKQLDHAATRISELNSGLDSYSAEEVRRGIYRLGLMLWNSKERSVLESDFLKYLNGAGGEWQTNLVNLLSQEGILFRNPTNEPGEYSITPVFDMLGGYMIANSLLISSAVDEKHALAHSPENIKLLFGANGASHPLAQDIIKSLIAIMPSRTQKQFWMVVPSAFTDSIVALSTLIDSSHFCDSTLSAYRAYLVKRGLDRQALAQLRRIRASSGHPLNAAFLDRVLRTLDVASRDLTWTEYLRANEDDILKELSALSSGWTDSEFMSTDGNRLRATWVSWMLSSTCVGIRSRATYALFCFGQKDPEHLLGLTARSLTINDPYVPERLLAASYGALLTLPKAELQSSEAVKVFVEQLYIDIFSPSATCPSTHALLRGYASCLIQLVAKLSPSLFTKSQLRNALPPFPSLVRRNWGAVKNEKPRTGVSQTLHMDFENYTIGRLVPGRSNYDYDHPDYIAAKEQILWRIENLGWTEDRFSKIDGSILTARRYAPHMGKMDRYGKKYSWIAYYELAGEYVDKGLIQVENDRFDADIDPTFPSQDSIEDSFHSDYLGVTDMPTADWITQIDIPELATVLEIEPINGELGSWVALSVYISEESRSSNRNFYVQAQAVLIEKESLNNLVESEKLSKVEKLGWIDKVETRQVFAGELNPHVDKSPSSEAVLEVWTGRTETRIRTIPVVEHKQSEDGSLSIVIHEGEEQEITTPIADELSVIMPIAIYSPISDGADIDRSSSNILTADVLKVLDLHVDSESLGVFDRENLLVTNSQKTKGYGYFNSRDIYYMRREHLLEYCDRKGLGMIWLVRGERRYADMDIVETDDAWQDGHKTFDAFIEFLNT